MGTGYFLDKCKIPIEKPRMVFCDISQNCLDVASERLKRFDPTCFQRSILEPIKGIGEPFQAVALNYVLHCIPGAMSEKGKAFRNIADVMEPGGVLFGSTILTEGVKVSRLGRWQMRLLTKQGFFYNDEDSLESLTQSIKAAFGELKIDVRGCVGIFVARKT